MGTRSLTVVIDEWNNKEIVVMYRQMDGYPRGHGLDLAKFLKGFTVGNGINSNNPKKYANGMGCLCAQIVEHFKHQFGVGGIYLYPAGTRDCDEEYIYTVSLSDTSGNKGSEPRISVYGVYEKCVLQSGTASDFYKWAKKQD